MFIELHGSLSVRDIDQPSPILQLSTLEYDLADYLEHHLRGREVSGTYHILGRGVDVNDVQSFLTETSFTRVWTGEEMRVGDSEFFREFFLAAVERKWLNMRIEVHDRR